MAGSLSPPAPAAVPDGRASAAAPGSPTALVAGDARKLLGLLGAVVAPATLVTALAYYFGWRRERAFSDYFGIDPSVLGFSSSDYVLRSVDALFVPVGVVLLVLFAALCVDVLFARRLESPVVAPALALAGLGAVAIGLALAAGHPVASSYGYLQALGPGVGVLLVVHALARRRVPALTGARYLAVAVALVSLFWATSEYADSRGRSEAIRLARHLDVNPSATVFSKDGLNINTQALGSGVVNGCPAIAAQHSAGATYQYSYGGFTLLIRSGGKYFLTPTPGNGVWNSETDAIFVISDDSNVRIQLTRGSGYPAKQLEGTVSPLRPLFTC